MNLENLTRNLIHKASYGFIEYIPEITCLRIVSIGFKLSDEVREEFNIVRNFLQQRPAGSNTFLLYDLQEAEPLLDQDLEWIAYEWKPQVIKLGVMYVAIVIPKNEFAQLNVEIIKEAIEESQSTTTDRYFPDNESAWEWVMSLYNKKS